MFLLSLWLLVLLLLFQFLLTVSNGGGLGTKSQVLELLKTLLGFSRLGRQT